MKFDLPLLPYDKDALEPHISVETVEYHYEKHHLGYLQKLQKLIGDTPTADNTLEEIIANADNVNIFNQAAQVWNHNFYWHSLSPEGGGEPPQSVAQVLTDNFGSVETFRQQFADAALSQFGSGWTWLVKTTTDTLAIETTSNAGNPLTGGSTPLLVADVWEHAYYLDYRNARNQYVDAFLQHLINWQFIGDNLRASR